MLTLLLPFSKPFWLNSKVTEFQKNLAIDDIFELIFKLVPIYCILLLSPDIYQRREQDLIYF